MKKISRRSFLAAGAAVAVTGSALNRAPSEAQAYEYQPPSPIPYSPKREEINRIVAQDGKPRIVRVGDRLTYAVNYTLANMVMIETDDGRQGIQACPRSGRSRLPAAPSGRPALSAAALRLPALLCPQHLRQPGGLV